MSINLKNNWEFNSFEIYNFNNPGSFDGYLNLLKKSQKIKGDLIKQAF